MGGKNPTRSERRRTRSMQADHPFEPPIGPPTPLAAQSSNAQSAEELRASGSGTVTLPSNRGRVDTPAVKPKKLNAKIIKIADSPPSYAKTVKSTVATTGKSTVVEATAQPSTKSSVKLTDGKRNNNNGDKTIDGDKQPENVEPTARAGTSNPKPATIRDSSQSSESELSERPNRNIRVFADVHQAPRAGAIPKESRNQIVTQRSSSMMRVDYGSPRASDDDSQWRNNRQGTSIRRMRNLHGETFDSFTRNRQETEKDSDDHDARSHQSRSRYNRYNSSRSPRRQQLDDDYAMEVEESAEVISASRICSAMLSLMRKMHTKVMAEEFEQTTPTAGIDVYASSFEKYWNKYLENHLQRVCAASTYNNEQFNAEMMNAEDWYSDVTLKLTLIRSKSAVHGNELEATSMQSDTQSVTHNSATIGRINIEVFKGDLDRWAYFKAMYEQLIHRKSYDAMHKYAYLLEHLGVDSEPYGIIHGFEMSPSGYEAAWKALCDTYDNEHRMVMALMEKYYGLPALSATPSRADMMTLVSKTTQLTMTLTSYNIDVSSWDVALIGALLLKVDARTKAKWMATNMSHRLPKLSAFLEFLKARAENLQEANQSTPRAAASQSIATQQSSAVSTAGRNNQHQRQQTPIHDPTRNRGHAVKRTAEEKAKIVAEEKCPLCKKSGHRLFSCPDFKMLPVAQRKVKARDLGVCNRCLRLGCAPTRCTMSPCTCGELHNRALCAEHIEKMRTQAVALAATIATKAANSSSATNSGGPQQRF